MLQTNGTPDFGGSSFWKRESPVAFFSPKAELLGPFKEFETHREGLAF